MAGTCAALRCAHPCCSGEPGRGGATLRTGRGQAVRVCVDGTRGLWRRRDRSGESGTKAHRHVLTAHDSRLGLVGPRSANETSAFAGRKAALGRRSAFALVPPSGASGGRDASSIMGVQRGCRAGRSCPRRRGSGGGLLLRRSRAGRTRSRGRRGCGPPGPCPTTDTTPKTPTDQAAHRPVPICRRRAYPRNAKVTAAPMKPRPVRTKHRPRGRWISRSHPGFQPRPGPGNRTRRPTHASDVAWPGQAGDAPSHQVGQGQHPGREVEHPVPLVDAGGPRLQQAGPDERVLQRGQPSARRLARHGVRTELGQRKRRGDQQRGEATDRHRAPSPMAVPST